MRKPCCGDKLQDRVIKKGAWSKQEDQKLIDYIQEHGEGCWRSLPKAAGLLRCGKSCRLRWTNYLRPDVKRGNFAEDEEDLILKLHALLGNKWSMIAGRLPGRTDNEVKNYWNSYLRRKLERMGIDPNNHRAFTLPLCKPMPSRRSAVLPFHAVKHGQIAWHGDFCSAAAADDDRLSDALSCGESNSNKFPYLNLDLTISMPAPAADDDRRGFDDAKHI